MAASTVSPCPRPIRRGAGDGIRDRYRKRVEVSLVGLALFKEIVQQSGVTQANLASIMGIEQGTVSKITTGARSITVVSALLEV